MVGFLVLVLDKAYAWIYDYCKTDPCIVFLYIVPKLSKTFLLDKISLEKSKQWFVVAFIDNLFLNFEFV